MVSANPPWRHQYYTPEGLPSKPPFEMGVANFASPIIKMHNVIQGDPILFLYTISFIMIVLNNDISEIMLPADHRPADGGEEGDRSGGGGMREIAPER